LLSVDGGIQQRIQRKDSIMAVDINEMNKMFVVEWNEREKDFIFKHLAKS
jgi:hypothetical protein